MIRLSDLSGKARTELLRRVAALGLCPKLWPGMSEPPNSFHREGVGWHAGEFLYRADAQVHGLAHEVGHVSQLTPKAWAALDREDPRTSEDVALIVQVELCRGIAGLGAFRMLREMQDMGYSFTGYRSEVGALQWWRRTVPHAMYDELTVAETIAALWAAQQKGEMHERV
jgi:hypothetical protein